MTTEVQKSSLSPIETERLKLARALKKIDRIEPLIRTRKLFPHLNPYEIRDTIRGLENARAYIGELLFSLPERSEDEDLEDILPPDVFVPIWELGTKPSTDDEVRDAIRSLPTYSDETASDHASLSPEEGSLLALFYAAAMLQSAERKGVGWNEEFLRSFGNLCRNLPQDELAWVKTSTFKDLERQVVKKGLLRLDSGQPLSGEEPGGVILHMLKSDAADFQSFLAWEGFDKDLEGGVYANIRWLFSKTLRQMYESVYGDRFGFHPDRIDEDVDGSIREERGKRARKLAEEQAEKERKEELKRQAEEAKIRAAQKAEESVAPPDKPAEPARADESLKYTKLDEFYDYYPQLAEVIDIKAARDRLRERVDELGIKIQALSSPTFRRNRGNILALWFMFQLMQKGTPLSAEEIETARTEIVNIFRQKESGDYIALSAAPQASSDTI